MEPEEKPQEPPSGQSKPRWDWIAVFVFWVVLTGAALALAYGGTPSWAEGIAAALLWTYAGLGFFIIAVTLPITFRPFPEHARKSNRQAAAPQPRRSWVRRVVHRLWHLLLIVALVVGGRPVLAGLYLLLPFVTSASDVQRKRWLQEVDRPDVSPTEWAIYRAFRWTFRAIHEALRHAFRALRFAFRAILGACWLVFLAVKWSVWIPFVAALAAELWIADAWLNARLRNALGLPRGLAYLLYARRYRWLWKLLPSFGFWLGCVGLAGWLAFGGLSVGAAGALTNALWAAAIALSALSIVAVIFALTCEDSDRYSLGQRPLRIGWRDRLRTCVLLLFRVAVPALLWVAGESVLAGVYVAVIFFAATITGWWESERMVDDPPLWREPHLIPAAIGLILILAFASPIWIPLMGVQRLLDLRLARRLREAFDRPDGLVYVLYADPHQHEHFLGANGILAPLGERVVARDWRHDVAPKREAIGSERFQETLEGKLLKRFEILSMREHLPFVAVVGPRWRFEAFKLNLPYRRRRRDDGRKLGKYEAEIRKAARFLSASPQTT